MNESSLGIYGTLAARFSDFENIDFIFGTPTLRPHFYLPPNEHFLREANSEFSAEESEIFALVVVGGGACGISWSTVFRTGADGNSRG